MDQSVKDWEPQADRSTGRKAKLVSTGQADEQSLCTTERCVVCRIDRWAGLGSLQETHKLTDNGKGMDREDCHSSDRQ